LKNYLVQGYVLNQKRLIERETSLKELQETIEFISSKASHPQLTDKTGDLLRLINEYANALTILHEYDSKLLKINRGKEPTYVLTYESVVEIINEVRSRLGEKGEATELFGREVGHKLKGIIGALYQTFDRKELYASMEEKAAHILYLIIKDHPFSDGNKRVGSLLFVYFVDKNGHLRKVNGEPKFNDNTVVALSLLIAASDPREKETMIKIITNLLK
jgi:prophage maintenance system killer protein